MTMHKLELTELERTGLIAHSLPVDSPSQLSDAFRLGVAWALKGAEDAVEEVSGTVEKSEIKVGGSSMNKDQKKFEDMYLGVWRYEPKYPSLEELDEMISSVESTEGLSKSEINMRTKELRKIRKDVYGGEL